MSDIHERLVPIFREAIGEHVQLHDGLTADATDGWDSLAHVNLMFAIEEEFGIRFGQDEMVDLQDVGELKELIARKVDGRPR